MSEDNERKMIGFDRERVEQIPEFRDGISVSDPTRRAMRYIDDYVVIDRIPEGGEDVHGKIISANSNEILLLPYVSVLSVPGSDPLVRMVEDGKPMSVHPRTVNDIQEVGREYLDMCVLGLQRKYGETGDEKDDRD